MATSLSPLLTFDWSLDDARRMALEAYDHMQRDWWATAYWGAIWTGGFIVTFLLVRMLFTRWGERDITRKTLGVSLLVHLLLGLISNTVVFGPAFRSEAGDGVPADENRRGDSVSIRQIVDDPARGVTSGAEDQVASTSGSRPLDKSPAWEQAPQLDAQKPARLDRSPREIPNADANPRKQFSNPEPLSVPSPTLAERSAGDVPLPEPARPVARAPAVAETATPKINEETAQARPTAGTGSGISTRAPAGSGVSNSAEVAPRQRTAATDDLRIEANPVPPSTGGAPDPGPQVLVGRASGAREPARTAPSAPRATAAEDGSDSAPARTNGGEGGPATGPFARTGRPIAGTPETGSLERTRPGAALPAGPSGSSDPGAAAASGRTGGSPGAAVASTSSGAESGVGVPSPHMLRSDAGGAIDKNAARVPAPYRLRRSPQREKFAIDMGANEKSEQAVEASLQWLATNQHQQGFWEPIESTLGSEPDKTVNFPSPQERARSGFGAESGLTALAVLAFLGKGYTHEDNLFSDNVDRALRWLISQQEANGFLGGRANRYARMYCHGMATIALGEAYGMTRDRTLREPLARAIQYIVSAQYPDGSWRYTDWRQLKDPAGDMSMFGWQLMALKSARTAGLEVPNASLNKAIDFLIANGEELKARRASQSGGLAAYRAGERPKPSMTAEALFCKQMLGIKRTNKSSLEAVEYLQQICHSIPSRICTTGITEHWRCTTTVAIPGAAGTRRCAIRSLPTNERTATTPEAGIHGPRGEIMAVACSRRRSRRCAWKSTIGSCPCTRWNRPTDSSRIRRNNRRSSGCATGSELPDRRVRDAYSAPRVFSTASSRGFSTSGSSGT